MLYLTHDYFCQFFVASFMHPLTIEYRDSYFVPDHLWLFILFNKVLDKKRKEKKKLLCLILLLYSAQGLCACFKSSPFLVYVCGRITVPGLVCILGYIVLSRFQWFSVYADISWDDAMFLCFTLLVLLQFHQKLIIRKYTQHAKLIFSIC